MWMQMVLFTLLFPVLPYVLWKCYNKEKKPERGKLSSDMLSMHF